MSLFQQAVPEAAKEEAEADSSLETLPSVKVL